MAFNATQEYYRRSPDRHPKKQPYFKSKWYWAVIALVALWILLQVDKKPVDPDTSHGGQAWAACEDYVREYLKAPSTAKFSGITETRIIAQGSRKYAVIGWVDSQNSFGARLRTKYICQTTEEGDGNWSFAPLVVNSGGE